MRNVKQKAKMILENYQLVDEIQERGYSQTAEIINEFGTTFFSKWIKGIKKDSRQSKILNDKLRHLKKGVHACLPKIIEYNWDKEKGAYCIVFENIKACTLKEKLQELPPIHFLSGMTQIVSCLLHLQQKHRLTHGDINPDNILVDKNFEFYLIDFGLSDITATLSQEQSLEIFAKAFAAPEKWNRKIAKGFPHQSDIFSIGKVMEWYFKERAIYEFETIQKLIDKVCEKLPAHRGNYIALSENLKKITSEISFDENLVLIEGKFNSELIAELNNEYSEGQSKFIPKLDISPKNGNNILIDIITKHFIAHGLWIIADNKLWIKTCVHKTENEKKYDGIYKYGKKLAVPLVFSTQSTINGHYNLTSFFKKIQKEKQQENNYRDGKKAVTKELKFYKDLLKKELEVLEKNALRLRYSSFEKKSDYEIWFKIQKNEKYSSIAFIHHHIDKATPPRPEEFEYILSITADKKQRKKPLKITGVTYDFNVQNRMLKFRDCEGLAFEKIPANGYLFENISKQEEEKKRQLDAIRKVEYNEVQNRDLIHYLFNPQALEGRYLDIYDLEKVYQTDEKGNSFGYSYNQKRAILNAIHREPLTVIQGPPGTGKTTVITEIVFQILHLKPDAKILITSQTNDAVDNVLDNLLKKEIPIVRLSGIRKPKGSLRKHTLERKIEGWKVEVTKRAKANWTIEEKQFKTALKKEHLIINSIFNILDSNKKWKVKRVQIEKMFIRFNDPLKLQTFLTAEEELIVALNGLTKLDFVAYFTKQRIHKDWLATISSLDEKSNLNQKLIDSIRVIGATTNHIASGKYKKYNFEFDYVIMDESGKATTAESLIPIVLAEKLILVGDHRQLRPMLTSNQEVERWLRAKYKKDGEEFDSWDDYFNRPSLFEQVIGSINEDFKSQLEECRRSSRDQVLLTSKCFYEPYGDEPIVPIERPKAQEHNLDLKVDSSIIFLDIGNTYKSGIDARGSSKNKESANLIPELLKGLDRFEKLKNYSIGVITGYSAQVNTIKGAIQKRLNYTQLRHIHKQNVTISVVDKFQGLEKDIIIFDLVRSCQSTLGFLANANRINVALSRQKKLLIIVGNLTSILNARPPKALEGNGAKPALQKYLLALKEDWIVEDVKQIF